MEQHICKNCIHFQKVGNLFSFRDVFGNCMKLTQLKQDSDEIKKHFNSINHKSKSVNGIAVFGGISVSEEHGKDCEYFSSKEMQSVFIIMHKKVVYKGVFFTSAEEARNYILFNYPKRRFKRPNENTFICANYGTTFNIEEIFKSK
jgi:hypothetical protein